MVRRVQEGPGYRIDHAERGVRGIDHEIAARTALARNDTPAYMDPRDPRALVAAESVRNMGISARGGASALWRARLTERASVTTGGLALLDPVSLGLVAVGGAALWGLHALWRTRERRGLRAAIARRGPAELLPRGAALYRHYDRFSQGERDILAGLRMDQLLVERSHSLPPRHFGDLLSDWCALDNVWALRVAASILNNLAGERTEARGVLGRELDVRERLRDDPNEIAMTRFYLAREIYRDNADGETAALAILERAMPSFRAAPRDSTLGKFFSGSLGLLGWLQDRRGEPGAEATLREAIARYPEDRAIEQLHGIPQGMLIHALIGITEGREDFDGMNEYCKLLRAYSEGSPASPEYALFAWNGLTRLALRFRDYPAALQASTRATDLADGLSLAMPQMSAIHALALIYNRRPQEAEEAAQLTLDRLRGQTAADGIDNFNTIMTFLAELQERYIRARAFDDIAVLNDLTLYLVRALEDHPTYAEFIRKNLTFAPITEANGELQ